MYKCRYCGFISHGNCCDNLRCRNYCNRFDDGRYAVTETANAKPPEIKSENAPEPCPVCVPVNSAAEAAAPKISGSCEAKPAEAAPMCAPARPQAPPTHPMPPAQPSNLPNDAHSLAFATVPFQTFRGIMPLAEGLRAGTAFTELYMPYDKKIIRRY